MVGKMTTRDYLEAKASPEFLAALDGLGVEIDKILAEDDSLAFEDVQKIIAEYYGKTAKVDEIERFSRETKRQIEDLQRFWGEEDVIWRCVDRVYTQCDVGKEHMKSEVMPANSFQRSR